MRLNFVLDVGCYRVENPLFEIDVELILEGVTPVVFVSQKLHARFEIVRQEVLSNMHALQLVHGLLLLLPLHPSVLKSLVLDLDPLNLLLDFLLPVTIINLSSLVIFILKLSD